MRIHYLQHVDFEDLAAIEIWAQEKGHSLCSTKFFEKYVLPSLQDFDFLIVLGGPMNIYEEKMYPWLVQEKIFIDEAIRSGKMVLGICLGAQLIADVLGSRVRKNLDTEIGWFAVSQSEGASLPFFEEVFPLSFTPFHWHGDTFDLPSRCVRLLQSEACLNQGFATESGTIFGLQCHLEATPESVQKLINACGYELVSKKWIQSPGQILTEKRFYLENKAILWKLLDAIETKAKMKS